MKSITLSNHSLTAALLILCSAVLLMVSNPSHAAQSGYYGADLCAYEGFTCVKVTRGESWAKRYPDPQQRDLVMRLNRMNMPIYHRSWIVIPDQVAGLTLMDLSPFPTSIEPPGEKLVKVNLKLQAFGAYNAEGKLLHWGPVSGGKGWCADINGRCNTATGSFRFVRKQGAHCTSSIYPISTGGGAKMPYCMHYYRGYALHGSTLPGYHASHGCVRLFNEDAQWLNQEFADIGTRVVVDSGQQQES